MQRRSTVSRKPSANATVTRKFSASIRMIRFRRFPTFITALLPKRRNALGLFARLRRSPTALQFAPVEAAPLFYQVGDPRWKLTAEYLTAPDIDHSCVASIFDMDVRRWVIIVKHADNDAEEYRNDRHRSRPD
jgi:hypothetical protein